MIREAGPQDRAAVEAILLRHADAAMFPLANLRNHGLGQGDFGTAHAHATRFWMRESDGVLALSRSGMLMPLLPDPFDAAGFRPCLAGLAITGAVGPSRQLRPLLAGLGFSGGETLVDRDEPGFALDLSALRVPLADGAQLIPASASHRALLVNWRADYHETVLGTPEAQRQHRAGAEVDSWIAQGSHRLLLRDGAPVALTGFNAALPEIVQIGGVYAPPALRGCGHARLAVALHLAEARLQGVARAVLFAATEAAAKAYLAIGFQPATTFALILFAKPRQVPS